jgi:assimilatory nitrate reductase catalytic subunit
VRVGDLVAAHVDPLSGQPEAKATPAALAPISFALRGFAFGLTPRQLPADTWWVGVRIKRGVGLRLASDASAAIWQAAFRRAGAEAELVEYNDAMRELYRGAAFRDGKMSACLFVGSSDAAWDHLWDQTRGAFEAPTLERARRHALLSGRSAPDGAGAGPVICSCFGVGLNAIRAAIESGAAASVEDIGRALRAGTNCGSCLPELKRIVAERVTTPTA